VEKLAVDHETAEESRYVGMTPGSQELHRRATAVMPGGTTRTTVYFPPYPLYLERGLGCRVWDVDGTERLDMLGNYTALILGHAHPAVVAAVGAQMERGTSFAAANAAEVALAEELVRRVRSLERVRFTNSGTEATMYAMRLARTFTGRPRMARIEGGYHGTHELAQVSTHPDLATAGPADSPVAEADSPGIPGWVVDDTVVVPFNDPDSAVRILREHARDVAGVIVEPVLGVGGTIPAEDRFLEALREVTSELGMLLIFDEVISFRVDRGGAQTLYGVEPDLTTLGKIIGGGLPVGAFGGRAEVMCCLDPERERNLPQGGTFNGHPLGMTAGLAQLRELTPAVFRDLGEKGEWLRGRLRDIFASRGVAAQITGLASLLNIHFTAVKVRDHRTMRTANQPIKRDLFLGLLNRGVLIAPRGMLAISTPVGYEELSRVAAVVEDVVVEHAAAWRGLQSAQSL
jgi:glutamate-1-semialdehyde 2,1-aminomutase